MLKLWSQVIDKYSLIQIINNFNSNIQSKTREKSVKLFKNSLNINNSKKSSYN